MIRIKVTAEDIEEGVRDKADECPVALAVKRAMPEAQDVCVFALSGVNWFLEGSDTLFQAGIPHYMRDWICDFDRGKQMAPIAFNLNVDRSES